MRQELEKTIGSELRLLAIRTRNTLKITQKDMAETLCMSESSYSDKQAAEKLVDKCNRLKLLLLHFGDAIDEFLSR